MQHEDQDRAGITIVLCDDHAVVRNGARAMLSTQADFRVIGEASDGLEAISMVGRLRPDVVLMDLTMPKMDGIEAIGRLKERSPNARVVALTAYDEESNALRALRRGAKGFLLKDAPEAQLFEAVRCVARGDSYIDPSFASRLLGRMDNDDQLTERETQVLDLASRGLTDNEVASRLYLSHSTVRFHWRAICEKLGARGKTDAVATAMRRKLV